MQPYLLPYLGYFQLIAAVDVFIVYDNIKYTKKGWINRNRYLLNGADAYFSVPLRKDSDYLPIRDRAISGDFDPNKLLNQIREAYRKAPQFTTAMPLVESIFQHADRSLFGYLLNSIAEVCDFLGISTSIVVSSTLPIDPSLKGQDKVIAMCREVGADAYINPMGGIELYSASDFQRSGIDLSFLRARAMEYPQFGLPHVPWLSILDLLMFNSRKQILEWIDHGYDLVRPAAAHSANAGAAR